jgi:hypothetical protein
MSNETSDEGREGEAFALDVWLDFLQRRALEEDAAFQELCRERP